MKTVVTDTGFDLPCPMRTYDPYEKKSSAWEEKTISLRCIPDVAKISIENFLRGNRWR